MNVNSIQEFYPLRSQYRYIFHDDRMMQLYWDHPTKIHIYLTYHYNSFIVISDLFQLTSLSSGRHLCVPLISTRTAACRIGHTKHLESFLGSNWTFSTGDGKRNFCSQSPDKISQIQTLSSVDADINWEFEKEILFSITFYVNIS